MTSLSHASANDAQADALIAELLLQPHPEGGYYRETFRDQHAPLGRAASTAIYFLLKAGEVSRWHTVDAAEVWHYYAGSSLLLDLADPGGGRQTLRLGPDVLRGERPQAVVPPGHWQRSTPSGGFTLVGCTVAPGFEFSGLRMAKPDFEPGA